jgi:hypothetical protein
MTNYTQDAAAGLQLALARKTRERMGVHPLVAERLRDGAWVVRPENQLGTCGYYPYPWAAIVVHDATSAEDALRKARSKGMVRK